MRHPAPLTDGPARTWLFRAVDLDIAGHINNAAYWETLEEELLAGPEPVRIDAEIEFRTPSQPGVKRLVEAGRRRWILGEEETHASVLVSELVRAGDAHG